MSIRESLSRWRSLFDGELMSDQWVARLMRTAGALVALVAFGSVCEDYLSAHGFGTWNTVSDVTAVFLGGGLVVFANWIAARSWKPILFAISAALVANYSVAAIRTRDVGEIFSTILLLEMGAGALNPWETGWQIALTAFCLTTWFVTTHFVPQEFQFVLDSWLTLGGGSIAGILSCHLRRTYERDRSAAQRKIRESEARLSRILRASPEQILIIRESDLMLRQMLGFRVNPEYEKEFVGKPITELEFFKSSPEQQRFIRDVIRNDEVHNVELSFKAGRRESIPLLVSGVRVSIDGEPSILCFLRNITELKRVQSRLADSERRFKSIFKAMPGSAAILELDGTVIDLNRPMTRSGYTRDEVIGHSLEAIRFWADPAERAEFEKRMTRDGRVDSMEVKVGLRGGGSLPTLISASPFQVDGKVRIVAIAHDIQELKDAQRRVEEGHARFRRIFNNSTDSMLLSDFANGSVIDVNQEFTRLTGYSREEVVGRNLRGVSMWSDPAKAAEFATRLRQTGEARNIEDSMRVKTGELVPCLMSGTLIKLDGRQCCLAIARDITEQKRVQEQLIEARETALKASRAKSEFLSSMSHEIRTPMNAILGMTDLLLETDPGPEQRKYLEVMAANGRTLEELINDILDLAKIESGKLELEQVAFDLVPTLERIVTSFGHGAHSKGLELTLRIAPEVPEYIVGDSIRLSQILINLVGNAIKFTESGEVAVSVENDGTTEDGTRLKFTVTDTGIGIAGDKLETIFSSFAQADSSTTRKYGGTGLGLSIAHRLVGLMGGEIAVESEVARGSKFTFTARFGLDSRAIAFAPDAPDLHEKRVLVVDDNATNLHITGEIITGLGAEVSIAGSREEALELTHKAGESEHPYHLVILDAGWSGSEGFEIAATLMTSAQRPPIVMMLSPGNLKSQLSRVQESGSSSYLVKPVTRSGLHEAISEAMGRPPAARLVERPAQLRPVATLPDARILIVEDMPSNRFLLSAYLRDTDCEFEFAANGQIALEKFMQHKYDLVLMDLQMPLMDGYSATRAIRAWEKAHTSRRTPVIALTAAALPEELAKAEEAGCDAHLTKPIRKATLIELMARWLAAGSEPGAESQARQVS